MSGKHDIVPAKTITTQRVVLSGHVVGKKRSWMSHLPKLLLIPLGIAAAYGGYAFLFPSPEADKPTAALPAANLAATPAAEAEKPVDEPGVEDTAPGTSSADASVATAALAAAEKRRAERHSLNKERAKTLLTRAERLREQLKLITEEASKWESVVEPLRTNDDGRFIAADPHWIDSFVESYQAQRVSLATEDELRERLGIVLVPVESAWERDDWSSPPDTEISTRLDEIGTAVSAAVEQARKPRLAIETILLAAKKEGKQSDRNLAETIEFLSAERAATKAREEQLERERETVTREQERMQAAEAEAELAKEEKAREAELLKLINDRKVKGLLQSFFQPGYYQPDGSMSPEKKPVSYSMLAKHRCLESTQAGIQHLMTLASERRDDARLRWPGGEAAKLSSSDMERYSMVQMILRDYGPDLVKLGKLSP